MASLVFRIALVVVALGVPLTAQAQALDLGLSCKSSSGTAMTSSGSTSIDWTGTWPRARCSVDYSNDSGTSLGSVYIRVTWDSYVETDLAPALPGGVEGLGATQTWRPASAITTVPGSPAPSFDPATQTALFNVGNVANLSAAELFFDWIPPSAMAAHSY